VVYGSICSGIEAASVAWKPLGWRCAFMSEIEKFPRAVLAHHYPHCPKHGDFTTIKAGEYEAIDLLVGGTPCQSFSVAGLRGGLSDDRGNLCLEFIRLAARLEPRWVLWENVPGVLSSGSGRDFGSFIGALAQLGYGWAYRVLDAQFFGVPQRRRRVFVVGCLGDARRAGQVLFEPGCLRGNPAKGKGKREGISGTVAACFGRSRGAGQPPEGLVPIAIQERAVSENINSGPGGKGYQERIAYTLEARHHVQAVAFTCKDFGQDAGHLSPTLRSMAAESSHANAGGQVAIAVDLTNCRLSQVPGTIEASQDRHNKGQGVLTGYQVRRLTPRECERLQGFPDDYTLIEFRGKPAADGPRYKAIGNSMAVPVMRWIGQRIQENQ
jgi:DNA (cytosine-5)-methyltransferase 1